MVGQTHDDMDVGSKGRHKRNFEQISKGIRKIQRREEKKGRERAMWSDIRSSPAVPAPQDS
jgi:hypothetical protein